MRVEIRSVLVFLKDPLFHAQLEMMDIVMESTSWEWKVVPLNRARLVNTTADITHDPKLTCIQGTQ